MITLRFRNSSGSPLRLFVEPWCTDVIIAEGSVCTIHYLPPDDESDRSVVEMLGNRVTFWCEGPDCEVEVDGEIVLPFGPDIAG